MPIKGDFSEFGGATTKKRYTEILENAAQKFANELRRKLSAQNKHPQPGPHFRATGENTAATISVRVIKSRDTIIIASSAPHFAALVEGTKPHVIKPKTHEALSFGVSKLTGGQKKRSGRTGKYANTAAATIVYHKGSKRPPFLANAVSRLSFYVREELRRSL